MKNDKNRISLKILIFLSIITTIIVASLSLSKFESSVATEDGTRVAYPIINLATETEVISVPISPVIGENTYTFSISNKEEEKQSEVSIEYTIQIESLENLPLEFELYTYDYQLKFKWREDETSYKYSKTIDYIQLIVNSYQKD